MLSSECNRIDGLDSDHVNNDISNGRSHDIVGFLLAHLGDRADGENEAEDEDGESHNKGKREAGKLGDRVGT